VKTSDQHQLSRDETLRAMDWHSKDGVYASITFAPSNDLVEAVTFYGGSMTPARARRLADAWNAAWQEPAEAQSEPIKEAAE